MTTNRFIALLVVTTAATLLPISSSLAAPDLEDPTVTVDLPRDAVLESPIELHGTASDNVAISKVRVSIRDQVTKQWLHPDGSWRVAEHRYFATLTPSSPTSVTWSFTAALPDGSYFANVRVADTSSNHAAVQPFYSFFVDGQDSPPTVSTNLARGTNFDSAVQIGGSADDDIGIRNVKVGIRDRTTGQWLRPNGNFQSKIVRIKVGLEPGAGQSVTWNIDLDLDPGSYAASIVAIDSARNRTPITPWIRFTVGTPVQSATLVAAGDVAKCGTDGAYRTADLLDSIFAQYDGTLALLGDGAYQDGKASEYANCYDPTWGRHKNRTKPAPGNHDYNTRDAAGYFGYFGARAGSPDKGYYAYDLGAWRVVAINTECDEIGGCGTASPQYQWLDNELANNPQQCTLVYGHRPRFDSGPHSDEPTMNKIFELLYEHRTSVALFGHSHNYQRYARLDGDGKAVADGVRSFIVGTGGTTLRDIEDPHPRLRESIENHHGVLVLQLGSGQYSWEFIDVDDEVLDSGTSNC